MKKMTLRELRAFTTSARLLQKEADIKENTRVSWSARTNAVFTALTVPVEKKGDDSPLLDAAKLVSIDIIEREYLETASNAPAAPVAVKENAVGSYEKLMGGFGGG